MGTVIELADHRTTRETRLAEIADRGSRHPALRWVAGQTFWIAHRRTDQGAACGAEGALTVASPGVPLCENCYPQAASRP